MSEGERMAERIIADQEKVAKCGQEIEAVLKKYNCMMDPIVSISRSEGIHFTLKIMPRPLIPPPHN